MFDFDEELKRLPDDPGVYIMHDKKDTVIYVGKAKVLKNRVRQYFHKSANHSPKVRAMVAHVAYFEYIITDSELEALVLECTLIKKYRPKYNILLKDDKAYPYIKVTMNEEYPRIMMCRRPEVDGAKYFGPYIGSGTLHTTLDMVQKVFKPPTCNRKFPADIGKGRPCLNYHIKNCFAPCTGEVSKEEYRRVYSDICSFIEGKHTELLKALEQEMKAASDNMDYMRAATYRDRIRSIKAIEQKQKIVDVEDKTDRDVAALALADDGAYAEIFFIRAGRITGRENFRLSHTESDTAGAVMADFLKQFYSAALDIPREILLSTEPEEAELIAAWLTKQSGRTVTITVPQRGEKKWLVEMVMKNAETVKAETSARDMEEFKKSTSLSELAKLIGMTTPPERIESYDISNISGTNNVASMVVFENGRAAPSKYRKFKIKTFDGADDYRAMREVLHRRFLHAQEEEEAVAAGTLDIKDVKFLPRPDLILADGGKGHVKTCKEMLEMMELDIPVYGMVKDDRHRTRGLTTESGEIELNMTSPAFHLITRIQDEVHRTAIAYHRKLRAKNAVKSELDAIPGIGAKRRTKLLKAFGSIDNIRAAHEEDIAAVEGITRANAKAVRDFFDKKD